MDTDKLPRTRSESIRVGSPFYFTGKPCKYGHKSIRRLDGNCIGCQQEKHATTYPARKKEIAEGRARKYREDPIHRERLKERGRQFYADNPESHNERKRLWVANNPERARLHRREAYRRNPAVALARSAEWRAKNPEAGRVHAAKRRARIEAAPGSHSIDDIVALAAMQRDLCNVCESDISGGYHVDHVWPISRGGSNSPFNLQLLCPRCNREKRDRDPLEFLKSKGLSVDCIPEPILSYWSEMRAANDNKEPTDVAA